MEHVIHHTIIDCLRLLPFLFVTFLLMEYFEHKMKKKTKKTIKNSGRMGPLFGSIIGAFPQCGFSVAATNLYATRIITLGTLISIYLSTSDEMLPILISEKVSLTLIVGILLIKIIVGMIAGFIIDCFARKVEKVDIEHFCHEEHCHCEQGIFKSTLKHTFDIFIFLVVITFLLNLGLSYLGEEFLNNLFLKDSFFGPFLTSLIGLIPNCGASVVITQLYLNHTISFASMISGLLTGSGVALLVLFKVNKDKKENFKIISLVYIIGVLIGIFLQLLSLFI